MKIRFEIKRRTHSWSLCAKSGRRRHTFKSSPFWHHRQPSGPELHCTSTSYDHPAFYSNEDAVRDEFNQLSLYTSLYASLIWAGPLQFSERAYWDSRYVDQPRVFEWYRGYNSSLKPLLNRYFAKQLRLLQVGVGTSEIQYDMVQDGYQHIVNTDYSSVAIEQMKKLHEGVPQLEYHIADTRAMPQFGDATFGGVLDKGVLDALLCGENDDSDSERMMSECYRVLEPGGVYMCITHAPPQARLRYLAKAPWHVMVYEVGQQGSVNGPYKLPSSAIAPGSTMLAELGLPKMAYSHCVYVCRKPVLTCGLQDSAETP